MSLPRGLPYAGCERLPDPLSAPLTLYVQPPVGHVVDAVRRTAADVGCSCTDASPGILAVSVIGGAVLASLPVALQASPTAPKLAGTPALAAAAGEMMGIAHLMRARPLDQIVAQIGALWLAEIVDTDALVTHLQPLGNSRDPDRVFGYECHPRGRRKDGEIVPPQARFRAAVHAGLLYHLDRAPEPGRSGPRRRRAWRGSSSSTSRRAPATTLPSASAPGRLRSG